MKSFKQHINESKLSDLHILAKQGLGVEKVNAILQLAELLNIDWRRVKDIINESVELDESKMSELHMLIKQGKSAEQIAKIMKVDVKTIKILMKGYKESVGR